MKTDRNFIRRTVTALLLAPAVLGVVWHGGILFHAITAAAALLMCREWLRLTRTSPKRLLWWLAAVPYLCVPMGLLSLLREMPLLYLDGAHEILFLLTVVWATDIGAYLVGKKIGGPRFAPYISPNKTWAGCYGGLASATVFGAWAASAFGQPITLGLTMSCTLSVVAQMGDLFESWLKRRFHVKDTGMIIPGHGGLLDRLDSLLFVTPAFALEAYFLKLPQIIP